MGGDGRTVEIRTFGCKRSELQLEGLPFKVLAVREVVRVVLGKFVVR
jgi:hypothetical protein